MEYERTEAGQIQADFASRAGQLLLQYDIIGRELPIQQQYEATLAVALLQSMLTICHELLKQKSKYRVKNGRHDIARRSVLDEPALMGLEPGCVVEQWPSTRSLTYRQVFECLRNALCHPGTQGGTTYPITGYTTVVSGSGCIEVFEFVQSSWVNSTGSSLNNHMAPDDTDEKAGKELQDKMNKWADNVAVVGLVTRRNAAGQWRVYLGDSLFVPVLKIRLTVQQLRTLTLTLLTWQFNRAINQLLAA